MRRSVFLLCVSACLLSSSSFATAISPLLCGNPGSTTASSADTSINANSCTDFAYPLSSQPAPANNWLYGYLTAPNTAPATLDPSTFTLMTPAPTLNVSGQPTTGQAGWYAQNFFDYWTSLDAFGGHSNATFTDLHTPGYCNPDSPYFNCSQIGGLNPSLSTNDWADRRYVVPDFTGSVAISVQAQKDPRTAVTSSQPSTDYVLLDHDGTVTVLDSLYVPVSMGGSQSVVSWTGDVDVSPGDFIDFVIVPKWNSTLGGYADFASGQFELDTIQSLDDPPPPPPPPPGVPEPATFGLLGAGLVAVALLSRRIHAVR